MSSPLFELNEAAFIYGSHTALHPVTAAIHSGERVALLGANGSGKTTLLRLLAGLIFPSHGEILFQGKPLSPSSLSDPAFRRHFRARVGIAFQHAESQLFSPTVAEEIAFGPQQLGLSLAETRQRVQDMQALFHLEPLSDRYPGELSGGEQRKVVLASVLAMAPDVLLLDEPTAGLDPRSQGELKRLLAALGDNGKTLVTATHGLGDLEQLYDRVLVLSEAHRLVWEGSPGELLRQRELLVEHNLIGG